MSYNNGPRKISLNRLTTYLDAGNPKSYPGTGNTWFDLCGTNDFTKNGGADLTGSFFNFPGLNVTDYFICNPFVMPTGDISIETEVYVSTSTNRVINFASYAVVANSNEFLYGMQSSTVFETWGPTTTYTVAYPFPINTWVTVTRTRNTATGIDKIYFNGTKVSTTTFVAGTGLTSGGSFVLGQEQDSVGGGFDANQSFQGRLGFLRVYAGELSEEEVMNNYLVTRGRYGS